MFLKIDFKFLKIDFKFLKIDFMFLKIDFKFLKIDFVFLKIDFKFWKIDFKFSGKCFQAICAGCNFVQCATLQRAQKGRFISLQINNRGILIMINTKLCWIDEAFPELFSSHLDKDVVCRLQTPQVILNSGIFKHNFGSFGN